MKGLEKESRKRMLFPKEIRPGRGYESVQTIECLSAASAAYEHLRASSCFLYRTQLRRRPSGTRPWAPPAEQNTHRDQDFLSSVRRRTSSSGRSTHSETSLGTHIRESFPTFSLRIKLIESTKQIFK